MALLNVNPMQHVNRCLLDRTDFILFKVQLLPMPSKGNLIIGLCNKLEDFHTRITSYPRIVGLSWKPLIVDAKFRKRANSRTESVKIRNRRLQRKYNGTPTKPRLSVFCSDKQLYAMLVDDVNKKCLFYGSTLQKALQSDPDMGTVEAAKVVGEELVKAATNLSINEISSYDRNGCVPGERVKAFEIALSQHGFLPR